MNLQKYLELVKRFRFTRIFILSLALGLGAVLIVALFWVNALGAFKTSTNRYITVTGTSQEDQANQLARFSATISSLNASKEEAVKTATEQSDKLLTALKDFGIEDMDLKTQSMNIYREQESYYEDGVAKFRPADWNASFIIDITLRDIKKASDLTDLLAKSEATNIWGPDFSVDNQDTDTSSLMVKAYADAKTKATVLATAAGKKLGPVISIVDTPNGSQSVLPYYGMERGAGGGGYSPGATSLYGAVAVTFELR